MSISFSFSPGNNCNHNQEPCMVQLDEKLLIKSTYSYFLVAMVANSSKNTLLSSHSSDERVACSRNGRKHRVLFLNRTAATISTSREMLPVELQAVIPSEKGSCFYSY